MEAECYAHTVDGASIEDWQPLLEHLEGVAGLAARHAEPFGSAAWGNLAGGWHDLGKYAPDWQQRLRSFATDPEVGDVSVLDAIRGRIDHSSAGAVHVLDRCSERLIGLDKDELPSAEKALAMVIAGHHSGLPEHRGFEAGRLAKKKGYLDEARRGAPPDLLGLQLPTLIPSPLRPESFTNRGTREERHREKALRYEFWTRMLFSALIDADRLDTERAMDRPKFDTREASRRTTADLGAIRDRVDAHLEKVASDAKERAQSLSEAARPRAEALLALRAEVLDACRVAAERDPGRHTLTVPTGGGKTLAALAFALRHAMKHGLRRVIVVIPFTSIIDQTARVYREAFGEDLAEALVEHHSNLDPAREAVGNRLASENWDAPIIVTTSVQFFESLFSRRGTATRKLHNIARSVVLFDEVQALPHTLREPIFEVLNQLVDHYGVSALFCTATQPALDLKSVNRQGFPHLANALEVVQDIPAAFRSVGERVVVDFSRVDVPMSWEDLATEIKCHPQALAIVHRRADARDLCRLVPGAFHLSARMCPAHRREVLAKIDAALKSGSPCRVISTTLVEAGVDLDFPVVYRVLGGVDALAQAAGRCNREGRLVDSLGQPIPGQLIIFRPTTDPPAGLKLGAEVTGIMLKERGTLELFDPATYTEYFHRYFQDVKVDARNVMGARHDRDFPEIEARFKMIEDQDQVSIVVPHGDAAERIRAYERFPSRETLRALQPYLVNVPTREADFLAGQLQTINDQVRWLSWKTQYDPIFGLIVDVIAPSRPASLIFDEPGSDSPRG